MPNVIVLAKDYPELRRKVEETLLSGRQKIEEAKVQTYWMTGKIINDHILENKSRADNYGSQVVEKLAEDIRVHPSVLWRCSRFAQSFKKILAGRQESLPKGLAWSHFRELIKVSDEDERLSFMRRASKSRWTSEELAQKIQQEHKDPAKEEAPVKRSYPKLIPKKGQLYTYRLIELDPLHKKSKGGEVVIDVGFKNDYKLPDAVPRLKAGTIIESLKEDGCTIRVCKRGEKDLYTYKASVERVVDGDTLYVHIDEGFGMGIFQYLRLRGINCPETDTPEGKKAKAFIERELAQVPYIILTSSRSDKYDRYLADVWYGEGEGEKYLNGLLLDEGLAERME